MLVLYNAGLFALSTDEIIKYVEEKINPYPYEYNQCNHEKTADVVVCLHCGEESSSST